MLQNLQHMLTQPPSVLSISTVVVIFLNIYRINYFGNNTALYIILPLIAKASFSHDQCGVRKQQSNLHLFILNSVIY